MDISSPQKIRNICLSFILLGAVQANSVAADVQDTLTGTVGKQHPSTVDTIPPEFSGSGMEVMSDVLLNLLTSKADATKAEEMMDSVREYLSKYPGMSDEEKRLIVRTSVTPFFTEQFSPCLMGHAVGLREDKDLPRLLGYARLLEPYLTEQDFHQAMIAYMMRYGKGRIAFLLYDTNPSVYANTKRRKNLLETHLARWKWKALSLQFQKRCGENHLGKEVRTELLEGVVGELTNMRYRVE